jgi:hypothetical protein
MSEASGAGSVDLGLIFNFICGISRPYVSEDASKKLKLYKYQGGDSGFIYKLLYNPLALKIVENYTPEWLA